MRSLQTQRLVAAALEEDLGLAGDLTSRAIFSNNRNHEARFLAREPVTLAGLEVAREVFAQVDPNVLFECPHKDGSAVGAGDAFCVVRGPVRPLLAAERVALNFLQHLSGVATQAQRWVEVLADYDTRLLDTRKTLPGLRALQKEAVRAGGGVNHRFGLFDGILIKDNHITACGSISEAIARARDHHPYRQIEIEVSTEEAALEALREGAHILLIDNLPPNETRALAELARAEALTEASGGITLANLAEYASTGVDFISAGALTHSVIAVDIAMKIDSGQPGAPKPIPFGHKGAGR